MKKVIIIEDSPTFCNMLGKKLEAKGWKTILCSADNGFEDG